MRPNSLVGVFQSALARSRGGRSGHLVTMVTAIVLAACASPAPPPADAQMPLGANAPARDRRILLIADRPSHGPGEHEHNAGVWLLSQWLETVPGVTVTASYDGWPTDSAQIATSDAIFIFCSGGDGDEVFRGNRAQALSEAASRGAGLMFYHWCVEPPADEGHQEMLDWIGGYFALDYSVNPVWEPHLEPTAGHPITRGVQPFTLRGEWYYHMRFRDDSTGITPILTAMPTPESLSRPDGPHSGNPDVRAHADEPQAVVWAYQRPDGGRGVGFTGGHYHTNLGNPNFRKVVLNSLLWIAGVEVPPNGVEVTVTPEQLTEHLDPKPRRGSN